MFFSKNVETQVKDQLSGEMGIAWTKDLGKYLGVSIFHKIASRNTFQFILNKVHQRLSS